MKSEDIKSVIDQICSGAEYKNMFNGISGKYPERGQFLIMSSHRIQKPLRKVGYAVQIRLDCGQFGSDVYFIRAADGRLFTMENESYIPMTPKQEAIALGVFAMLPDDEGFDESPEYKDCEGIGERGFIVKGSKTKPTPDTSFAVTIFGAE